MANMNDELAFMATLLNKIKWELFDLQHINISNTNRTVLTNLQRELINLSSKFHVVYDEIKTEFDLQLPQPSTKTNEPPLRTNDSGDYLTRMRKFDGYEREDDKKDFFH